jgi:hypothetical protein
LTKIVEEASSTALLSSIAWDVTADYWNTIRTTTYADQVGTYYKIDLDKPNNNIDNG